MDGFLITLLVVLVKDWGCTGTTSREAPTAAQRTLNHIAGAVKGIDASNQCGKQGGSIKSGVKL